MRGKTAPLPARTGTTRHVLCAMAMARDNDRAVCECTEKGYRARYRGRRGEVNGWRVASDRIAFMMYSTIRLPKKSPMNMTRDVSNGCADSCHTAHRKCSKALAAA